MRRRWFGVVLALFSSISISLWVMPALPASAASTVGCPGGAAGPPSPDANYTCPNGGAVVNGVYVAAATPPRGCIGGPAETTPPTTTDNYACPDGGSVTNGVYASL